MLAVLLRNRSAAITRISLQRANQSTKAIAYKQDLPPAEGYKAYDWERIPQKKGWSTTTQMLVYAAMTFYGWLQYERLKKIWRLEHLEMLDIKLAIQPLVYAERDRLYLRRIRQNYEEEVRLMKNVPDWEVGKWYHQPIFKTVPENHWIDPGSLEFWGHCDPFEHDMWRHWYFST